MVKKSNNLKVTLFTAGFMLVTFLLIFLLIKFWPAGAANNISNSIRLFGIQLKVSYEKQLIIAIFITGAIGGLIHSMTSFVEYVCNKRFKDNWTIWYLMRPFIGMLLALVFYFVVRAGFFTQDFKPGNINEIGFLAIAALAGMFSKQATDKLKEVFDNLFQVSNKVERKDPLEHEVPEIDRIEPEKFPETQKAVSFEIKGRHFVEDSMVMINGNPIASQFISGQKLTCRYQITSEDLEQGALQVNVKNPAMQGGNSNIYKVLKASS